MGSVAPVELEKVAHSTNLILFEGREIVALCSLGLVVLVQRCVLCIA